VNRFQRAAAALGLRLPKPPNQPLRYVVTLALLASVLQSGTAIAAGSLSSASVALSDPRPSATSSYTFTGSSVDGATAVKCVKAVWATTAAGDTAPTGFSGTAGTVAAASSTLINSSATGWSLARSDGTSSSGQNNVFQYTNATGVTPSTTTGATFVLAGLVNSSLGDTTYYLQLRTFANADCASSPIDNATIPFINTAGSTVSLSVDQSLTFTVDAVTASTSCDGTTTTQGSTATTIPFGTITSSSNGVVCQDLQAATNAAGGYTIYARYTAAPTNALAQTIADHAATNASPTTFSVPGTEAYGYTSSDSSLGTGTAARFTTGGQKWAAMTTTNAELAYESVGVATTTYHIGHQVGISGTTFPGTYTTTIIYTCVPVY